MNMPPPNLPRLHWSPVEPSWIVSFGLVILAALPHQIPEDGRRMLEHPIGSLLFAALSAFVAWRAPVLGVAMFIFLSGIVLNTMHKKEPFIAVTLNKETTGKGRRWFGEEMLSEEPEAIQYKTEDPILNYDKVTDQESNPWFAERELNEHPHAIQEKPVPDVPEYDEGGRH